MEKTQAFMCKFCGKLYKRNYLHHEKYCKENPKNKHRCLFPCTYLQVFREEGIKNFHCSVKDIDMHTYKAESRGLEVIKRTEKMPNECELFDCDFAD